MASTLPEPPLQDAIVNIRREPGIVAGSMTSIFADWLRSLVDRTQAAGRIDARVSLALQSASIAVTSLLASASGLYRVSWRFRITTPGGVSSSLQLTITTVEGGVTCTQSSAAYTGNVANQPQSGSFIVEPDGVTPVSYSTTYASNPAAAMQYELDLVVESI